MNTTPTSPPRLPPTPSTPPAAEWLIVTRKRLACPFCKSIRTHIYKTMPDGVVIMRYVQCLACGGRFKLLEV